MVAIPAGRITLSDRRTDRAWDVDLVPFEISVTPVTRGQYAAAANARPSSTADDHMPVDEVSWWDAIRYCNALSVEAGHTPAYHLAGETVTWALAANGFRLPTEAEWEYSCRAGTAGARYGELDAIAWYRGNSDERPHPVGGKEANSWGLHDTLGNVWEWCWDHLDASTYASYRVLRGGGWFDEHWSCRASVRRGSHPTYAIDDVGFRVVRGISGAG